MPTETESETATSPSKRPHVDVPDVPQGYDKKTIKRVCREIEMFFKDPPPNIMIAPDEKDITSVYALIVGNENTPYAGGFFLFHVKYPVDYPHVPPVVTFLTTDAGRVRINPNLYENGKVCLSILNTWNGPSWCPSLKLATILISIQSVLNGKPYHNEPGFEVERTPGDAERYNVAIRHETLRVAVCGMVENETKLFIPKNFEKAMRSLFIGHFDSYISSCDDYDHLNGSKTYADKSEINRVEQYVNIEFKFNELADHLRAIRQKLEYQPPDYFIYEENTEMLPWEKYIKANESQPQPQPGLEPEPNPRRKRDT